MRFHTKPDGRFLRVRLLPLRLALQAVWRSVLGLGTAPERRLHRMVDAHQRGGVFFRCHSAHALRV